MSDKGRNKGLTAEQVIDALRDTNGNMSLAARKLKVTRAAIAYYVREYPTVRAAHDEAAAYVSDIAEGHLVNAVIKGNLDQARYWLENKARDRGYGRAPQTSGLEGMNFTPEQLAGMTDEQLDDLIAKLDRLTRKG
jgi:Bacterial regulatory protein, Fis family